MLVSQVLDSTFNEEVLSHDKPVLVDFWAPWCGPCRMVAPVVDEIAQEYSETVKVVKLILMKIQVRPQNMVFEVFQL